MDALGVVIAQAGLEVAAEFGPALERGTTLLVALGLAGVDAFATARDKGLDFVRGTIDGLALLQRIGFGPLVDIIRVVLNGLGQMRILADGAGDELALRTVRV